MHIVTYVLAFIFGLIVCGLNFGVSDSVQWVLVLGGTFFLLSAAALGVIELHGRGLLTLLDNMLKARVLTAIAVLLIVAAVDALGLAGAWFGAEFARETGLTVTPTQEQTEDIKPLLIICMMTLPVIIALDIGIRAIKRRDIKTGRLAHAGAGKTRKALRAEFARLLATTDDRNPDRYIVVSSGVTAMSRLFDTHFGSPEKFGAAGRYAQPAYLEGISKIEEGLRGSGQFDVALGASLFRRYLIALSRGYSDLAGEFRAKLTPFIEETGPKPITDQPLAVEPVSSPVDAVVDPALKTTGVSTEAPESKVSTTLTAPAAPTEADTGKPAEAGSPNPQAVT